MSRMLRSTIACLSAALVVAWVSFGGAAATSQASRPAAQAATPAASRNTMTMALTGDSIITMKLSVHTEPQFLTMIDLIRSADAAFTNLEMLFHDYEPYPSTQSGGTYMRASPALAKELVWAGFDMVARANNHTNDYGVEGARLTTKYVAEAGLVQAGVGESLREAREAQFLETDKGRVALVSTASTFSDQSRAGESWGDTRARPGLNPLRFRTTTVLTRAQFDALRSAALGAGLVGGRGRGAGEAPSEMTLLERRFVVGDAPGTRSEPLKEDLDGMAAVVRNASRQADYVIVSSHTHEGGADRFAPPEFFVTFAHAMVDAGADVIVVSGPHVLRGIEIYKGRPIFYSLANFIFQNETLLRQPPENYQPLGLPPGSGVGDFNDRRSNNDAIGFPADAYIWESIIAMPQFAGKQLTEIKLYPISLGFKKPRTARGRPMFADPQLSKKIIEDVTRFSAPFGTKVEFKDGIGIVSLGSMRSDQ